MGIAVGASEWSRGDASDMDGENREVAMGGSTSVSAGNARVSSVDEKSSRSKPTSLGFVAAGDDCGVRLHPRIAW